MGRSIPTGNMGLAAGLATMLVSVLTGISLCAGPAMSQIAQQIPGLSPLIIPLEYGEETRATLVQQGDDFRCADGRKARVTVRLDSGDRVALPPDLLLGNGIDDLLSNPEVLCGKKEVLLSSVRIPLHYLIAEGSLEGGDWGDATPPNLTIAATFGAGLKYESDRRQHDEVKAGVIRRDRQPALCRVEANGLEYCSACPADPNRPGYCPGSDTLINEFRFKILDRQPRSGSGDEHPLLVACNSITGTSERPLRSCEGQYGTGSGLYVSYRFLIRGDQSIYEFDFRAYNDLVEAYLKPIFLP